MVAVVEFAWRMIGAGIFGIIVYKLSYWYKPGPVILFEVNKDLKVGLHSAVMPLCLTISLRLKRGREPMLNAKEVSKR